jgi:Icc-related predicted phosphoesterase
MKILAIGDPHGAIDKIRKIPIKGVDIILVSGDIGKADLMRKYAFSHVDDKKSWVHYEPKKIVKQAYQESFDSSLDVLKYLSSKAPVYLVYGNVESTDSETKKLSKKLDIRLPLLGERLDKIKGINIINNRVVNLDGLVLAGNDYFVDTGWVKRFSPGSKRRMINAIKETERANKFYNRLRKKNVDILLCHQPPYGILDKVNFPNAPKNWQGKHAGSEIILNYIKKKQPRLVLCGHIHEAQVRKMIRKTEVVNLGCSGGYGIFEFNDKHKPRVELVS